MIDLERLARLALGEADEAEAAELDEHVLACTACATTLERLMRIGAAIRHLVRAGSVAFPVTASLAGRLQAEGLVSRTYHVAKGAAVPCGVTADDIYALTTLEADLTGVTHATLVVTLPAGLGQVEMVDIPFDAARGTVSYVTPSARLRHLPTGRVTLELYASDARDDLTSRSQAPARLLGQYFLDHTAFEAS